MELGMEIKWFVQVLWYQTRINMASWIGVMFVLGAIAIIFAGQFFHARSVLFVKGRATFCCFTFISQI